jgi:long-chain fatty acid transport protein
VRLGIGLQALVGTFKSTSVFSASPADRLVAAPEDPTYDSFSELKVGPIFSPSANIGATFIPDEHIRIGISAQAPHWINAPAKVSVRLPTAVPFDNAVQSGNDAHVTFRLPAVVRLGVEARNYFKKDLLLRVEATYIREFWSLHDTIDVQGDNIQLLNVTGFPSPYAVPKISLPRNFEDSNSYHLGGELTFTFMGYVWDARMGASYEKSAIPPAWLSPLTIDTDKFTVAIGAGLHIGQHWRLDGTYAHVFASDATVDPGEAQIPRINPVRGNPTKTEAINGGAYSARADVLGVGLNYKF